MRQIRGTSEYGASAEPDPTSSANGGSDPSATGRAATAYPSQAIIREKTNNRTVPGLILSKVQLLAPASLRRRSWHNLREVSARRACA